MKYFESKIWSPRWDLTTYDCMSLMSMHYKHMCRKTIFLDLQKYLIATDIVYFPFTLKFTKKILMLKFSIIIGTFSSLQLLLTIFYLFISKFQKVMAALHISTSLIILFFSFAAQIYIQEEESMDSFDNITFYYVNPYIGHMIIYFCSSKLLWEKISIL